MNIIQRNFLRLLRAGAFGKHEELEPMSEWKWQRLYQLSQIHGVTPWVTDGLHRYQDDFFLQLSPTLQQQFYADETGRHESFGQQQFTNPLLDRKLQQLKEEAGPNDPTFNLLLRLIGMARTILDQGISLRQLILLGEYLRTTRDIILYDVLGKWASQLSMESIIRLEGSLLAELFHFTDEEIPFTAISTTRHTKKVITDIFNMTDKNATQWYFTQGKSIFVGTSDTTAMMWHMRHSASYMHYFPAEAITSLMSNFARSLSHIEE